MATLDEAALHFAKTVSQLTPESVEAIGIALTTLTTAQQLNFFVNLQALLCDFSSAYNAKSELMKSIPNSPKDKGFTD